MEVSMRSKFFVIGALTLAATLSPVAAFAQQMPVAPDGTSVNEPPAAGAEAAADACGNTPTDAFGTTTNAGMPTDINDLNPKDVTGARQVTDLSQVTGTSLHQSGNLVLISIPREAAMGTAGPTPATPDHTMAVIRLPEGCFASIADGSRVKAIGVPTLQGILNAELIQTGE
jgi:hypothetical protein